MREKITTSNPDSARVQAELLAAKEEMNLDSASIPVLAQAFATSPSSLKLKTLWQRTLDMGMPQSFWTSVNRGFPDSGAERGKGYQPANDQHEAAFVKLYDELGADTVLGSLEDLKQNKSGDWVDANKFFQWGLYAGKSSIAEALLQGLADPGNGKSQSQSQSQASYFLAGLLAGLRRSDNEDVRPSNDRFAELSQTHPDAMKWAIESVLDHEFETSSKIDRKAFLELISGFNINDTSYLLNHMMEGGRQGEGFAEAIRDLVLDLATSGDDLNLRAKFIFIAAHNYADNASAKKVFETMLKDSQGDVFWGFAEEFNKTFDKLGQERDPRNYQGFHSLASKFGLAYRKIYPNINSDELILAAQVSKDEDLNETAAARVLRSIKPDNSVSKLNEPDKKLAALTWLQQIITVA